MQQIKGKFDPAADPESGTFCGGHMIEETVATPVESKLQVFDNHHPPAADLLSVCVHCGFCLQTCPTYTLWGKEMDSPRGRIHLINMAMDGEVELTDLLRVALRPLSGMPGLRHCLPIGHSVQQADRGDARSGGTALSAAAARAHLPQDDCRNLQPSQAVAEAGRRASRLPVASVCSVLPAPLHLTSLLPQSLRTMERLMPDLSQKESSAELPPRIAAQGEKRRTVAMVTGCVQSVFTAQVSAATARVLAAEGCEVLVPQDQGCCGALLLDLGQEKEALDLARKMIDAFESMKVDAIVVNAAGCGAVLKDYGYLLRDDPEYRERAMAFSAKVQRPIRDSGGVAAAGDSSSHHVARRLPRSLPSAARPGTARAASRHAAHHSRSAIGGSCRSRLSAAVRPVSTTCFSRKPAVN